MSEDSCSSSTNTADNDGATTAITAIHPDIIQTHILTRLDGATLVSTSFASSQLHSLCTDETLWKTICNSNWPSTTDSQVQEIISTFPSGHKSFYSDSYPTARGLLQNRPQSGPIIPSGFQSQTTELISAIDIHCGSEIIYSKVVPTNTSTTWFMSSPFRVDLLDTKEIVPTPVKFDGNEETCIASMEKKMRLSWISIDPITKRAVNISSRRPVEVRRHWLTGEVQVRYATIMDAGIDGGFAKCGVDVTCGGEEGGDLHVREVSMQVEDIEGKVLSGKDSMGILLEAMEGKRVNGKTEEEKSMYEMFLGMRVVWKECMQKRERRMDMMCITTGVTIFMAFWMFILFR